ncbi:MAG: TonB-dependent receptor plug domain-containing protein [Muribaculaceae bacterium]|nr:TonB-dependent receptor plug domain-containing protein [Muribaculaceae bacterium]
MTVKRTVGYLLLATAYYCPIQGMGPTECIPTDSLHTTLPELKVSATPIEKNTKSSTPVFIIDSKSLQRKGILNLSDAMRRMPGVALKDYGGAGGMKTIAVRGLGAQHTGVSIDGITRIDSRNGQIDLARFSMGNVSSLELHIGDGDDIFIPARNAATPALLEISTFGSSTSKSGPKTCAQFRFGSFQYLAGNLRWTQNITERFGLNAYGEFIHAKNDYPFRLRNLQVVTKERRNNSRMNSGYGRLNARWNPSSSTFITSAVGYYDNDRQLPGQVRYYTDYSRETLHDRSFEAQAGVRSRLSEKITIRGDIKYNWESTRYRDPKYPGGVRDADYYQREAYATTSLLYQPDRIWSFNYSADYSYSTLSSYQASAPNPRPRRHNIFQTLTARIDNGRLSATARLLLTLSYNHLPSGEGARDARRLSPSISASWKILEDRQLYLRASYKDIFRLPTFTESYYFHFGSTELLPEKTQQFNLGLTWQIEPTRGMLLRATADGYINIVRDMIVAVPYNMIIWTNKNIGKATARGVDLTIEARQLIRKDQLLILNGNWSWQRVLNRTQKDSPYYGNQPAYMPVNSGGASLAWENPWVNTSIGVTAMSARWISAEHYQNMRASGFAEMSLTLYRILRISQRHSIELRADIRNLLNRQYEIIKLYPMPGINYMISIAWDFK